MKTNYNRLMISISVVMILSILFASCGKSQKPIDGKKKITIGLIAKSQSNAIFQPTKVGANDAAIELSKKYGIEVTIDWQTPVDENPQKQAEAIEQLARSAAGGISVSCSDAGICTPAINKAVELGVPVMCFDSDAPVSKRFAYFGIDDFSCGVEVMKDLAIQMSDKGVVAILAGNQSGPNLRKRVEGVLEELKKHPNMKLLPDGIFYHDEVPEKAAEAVNRAQTINPTIEGWAFVGGWPLNTKNALKWNEGKIKVVSVDALPPMIDYLETGMVQSLFLQNSYNWGYKSVEILLEKILNQKAPESAKVLDQLVKIDKANAQEYKDKWKKWLSN